MDPDSERERRIVARWMSRQGAEMLGPTLGSAYPVDEPDAFNDALEAIDAAERQIWDPSDRPAKTAD